MGAASIMLFRDVLMKAERLGGCIAFIGYENQTGINRIMPVRDMGYAYTCYMKQIKDIVAQNRAENNVAYTKVLHENQKLIPVATFVLYYGTEEWKRPLSLMDILDVPEEDKELWKMLINDYSIRVIHMVGQPEDVRRKYRSDYGVVADYLAYYRDKEELMTKFFCDTRKLIHVEQVLDMLDAFSDDARFEMVKQKFIEAENKEGNDSMCLLMDIFEEKSEEAWNEGMQRGLQEGREEGRNMQARAIAVKLLGLLGVDVIAHTTGLSIEEVEQLQVDNS